MERRLIDPRIDLPTIDKYWESSVVPSLTEYIRILNLSPMFDADWASGGLMGDAVELVSQWIAAAQVPDLTLEVLQLPDRTPTLVLEHPGRFGRRPAKPTDTVLMYGHLDKQPEFTGWHEGLGPWLPVRRGDRLYGPGGADDGYAVYSAVTALAYLVEHQLDFPRTLVVIKCSEESGSPDLAAYMAELAPRIELARLVVAMDSTCGKYDQLWLTTSLRGLFIGDISVNVLEQGAHSGTAGGLVPSSFRILRQLLSRIEDEQTGLIHLPELMSDIPAVREQEAGAAGRALSRDFESMFSYAGPPPAIDNPTDIVLANTWRSSLEITGVDGVPSLEKAGNTLKPSTSAKFALRLPSLVNAEDAQLSITRALCTDVPAGVAVDLSFETPASGWHAPITDPLLEQCLQDASQSHFGKPAITMSCGGSIPFMQSLSDALPDAQFLLTGVLGPLSKAHGPNEFPDLTTAKALTASMAHLLVTWAVQIENQQQGT